MLYELDEIISIEKITNTSLRYDITVKNNHNFYANSILVHNCENIETEVFTENKDSKFEVTLKLDGSSCSVYYRNGEVGVCSRNLELKLNQENASNTFIATATKTNLLTALTALGKNIMVQSEVCGPNVQGNIEKLNEHQLFVFDIFDIDNARYMAPDERIQTFNELVKRGFTGKHVPIIAHNVTLEEIGITDVATSKVFVDRPSLNATIAEGCVFKRMDGQFSFKSINNNYLLKHQHS
jgi:RNA ligase (TIGR02306 family)